MTIILSPLLIICPVHGFPYKFEGIIRGFNELLLIIPVFNPELKLVKGYTDRNIRIK